MPKINTAHGPMDSLEASQLFAQDNHRDTNFLLGIYHQLLEKSITDTACATRYILDNPERFNHKLVTLAKKHQFDSPASFVAQPTRVTTWPNLGTKENELLASNPDLYYDEESFRSLCVELGHAGEADRWISRIKKPDTKMHEAIVVIPFMLRPVFLERYIQLFV